MDETSMNRFPGPFLNSNRLIRPLFKLSTLSQFIFWQELVAATIPRDITEV